MHLVSLVQCYQAGLLWFVFCETKYLTNLYIALTMIDRGLFYVEFCVIVMPEITNC